MLAPVAVILRPGTSLSELDEWLRTEAGCRASPPSRLTRTYLDTFDGALFRHGLVAEYELLEGRRWLRVRRIDDTSALVQAPVARSPVDQRVGPEVLGDGRLRAVLDGPCGGRALLAMVHTEGTQRRYRLADELDKAVVRVSVTAGSATRAALFGPADAGPADGQPAQPVAAGTGRRRRAGSGQDPSPSHVLDPVVTISPVRGHDQVFNQLLDLLTVRFGARPAADPFRRAAVTAGLTLGSNPSNRTVALEPDQPAIEAVRVILARTAQVLWALDPGLRADWDEGFLNDLHGAVRTAQTVVRIAGEMLARRDIAGLNADLAALLAVTSRVRDLNVVLGSLGHDPVLAALGPTVLAQREEAHRLLVTLLDGRQWHQVRGALANPPPGQDAGKHPASAWASAALIAALERSCRPGPGSLHALTTLGDLIAVLASLYPAGALHRLQQDLEPILWQLRQYCEGLMTAWTVTATGAGLVDAEPALLIALGGHAERARTGAQLAMTHLIEAITVLDGHRDRHTKRLAQPRARTRPP